MYCLYNGEYGEHDLSFIPGLDSILKNQEVQYGSKVGLVVGDFTCIGIEYDWGRRDQRWKIKCNVCGKESYTYHAADWRRGKGRTILCRCRKERIEEEKARKRIEREQMLADKKLKREDTEKNREKRTSYRDEKWIGARTGNVVGVGWIDHGHYKFRCDCGREFTANPTHVFAMKRITDCRDDLCPYYIKRTMYREDNVIAGEVYEHAVKKALQNNGYSCELVGKTGDFGVDIIAECDGNRIAIQCKNHGSPNGVECVQEVYAGGRYYGLDKFAVVSKSGFTDAASKMAKVLGVYLCDNAETFEYPDDIGDYTRSLLPIYKGCDWNKKYYELNGEKKTLVDWCAQNGVSVETVKRRMKHGMSLGVALVCKERKTKYEIDGFTGSLAEIADRYGMIDQTLRYRIKHMGMTIEEAVKTPLRGV